MKMFSSSNRFGVEWFSHTTEEQPVIRLHARSYCIVRAYVAWSAPTREHTIDIRAAEDEYRLTASSNFQHAGGLFMYSEDITSFVQLRCDTVYEIKPSEPETEPFRWQLIVIYKCPFQPIRHLCVLLQENEDEQLWEAMQASLPTVTTQTNQTAQLYTLGYGANVSDAFADDLVPERHDLRLALAAEQIMPANYTDLQTNCPHPFIIAQQCPLPMPDLHVEQAADRVHLCLHDRVTCTTKITNTGLTAATHIQYRTTLPSGMRLVENSFTINDIPIPMKVDNHNVITIILRDMPVGDLLLVSFHMQVDSQSAGSWLHSATLDYHFRPEPNTLSIGNTSSNTVEYTVSPSDQK